MIKDFILNYSHKAIKFNQKIVALYIDIKSIKSLKSNSLVIN